MIAAARLAAPASIDISDDEIEAMLEAALATVDDDADAPHRALAPTIVKSRRTLAKQVEIPRAVVWARKPKPKR